MDGVQPDVQRDAACAVCDDRTRREGPQGSAAEAARAGERAKDALPDDALHRVAGGVSGVTDLPFYAR